MYRALLIAMLCVYYVKSNYTVIHVFNTTKIRCWGKHEVYVYDKTMKCQPTCPNFHECQLFRYTKCICASGYVRNTKYNCIRPEKCAKSVRRHTLRYHPHI